MSSVHRAAISVALALSPVVGTGCISISPPQAYAPNHVARQRACNQTLNSARVAESRVNLQQAAQLYELAHQQDPHNAECLHRLGVIYTHQNKPDRADFYYREAYKITPNNSELLADMGYTAFMRNDYEKSEAFLQQSYQINNKDPRTIANLGIALAWRGKDEASLAMFRQIGNEGEAQQRLASIQSTRGFTTPNQTEMAANTSKPIPTTPESAVRTTSYSTPSTSINLPSPSSMDSYSNLSVPSFEPIQLPTDTFSLPYATTTIAMPSELPPSPSDASIVGVIELPAPIDVLTEPVGSTTIPIEFLLPPIPAADDEEPKSLPGVVNLSLESDRDVSNLSIPGRQDSIRLQDAPRELKPSSPNGWRKSRPAREEPLEPDHSDVSDSFIRQTSVEIESTESKKTTHSICLVTLLEEMRPVAGTKQFEADYQSQCYRFSSQEALDKFLLNPRKYAPAAGGIDVVSVRNDQEATQGTYNFAIRFQRRLYLFSSRQNAQEFRRDPARYVAAE